LNHGDTTSSDPAGNAEAAAGPTPGVLSAVASLKEIVSLIMALTMTNTLVFLIAGDEYPDARGLTHVSAETAAYSALLIANIIRFYHGNVRHMDAVYGTTVTATADASAVKPARGNLGLDFFVIFGQSILFGVTSFYADVRPEFIVLFIALLFFDILWTVAAQQQQQTAAGEDFFTHQRNWLINNLVALVALLFLYAFYSGQDETVFLHVGAGVIALNTIADFVINWRFYFPTAGTPELETGT
jgi:hypothetical protein